MKNIASVKGLSSYESTLVIPITDRRGNVTVFLLLIWVAKVHNCIQEGLGFRTEDYVRVDHSVRESLVLGGGHRWSFQLSISAHPTCIIKIDRRLKKM